MFLRSKFQEIMPRKRSRSVSSKQSLPTDNNNNNNNNTTLTSPTINCSSAAVDSPSIFTSPRLFLPFSTKTYPNSPTCMNSSCVSEANSSYSNSIKKPFLSERKPNWSAVPCGTNESKKHLSLSNGEPTPVGLSGLVDALINDEEMDKKLRQESRMVLFGSPLRIQIPQTQPVSPPPRSPIEFGVKNKSSQLALYSPTISKTTTPVSSIYVETPRHFVGSLSPTEMELSEDYTCVITRGPNPRTTHIFDNCVVVKCNDGFGFVPSIKEDKDGVYVHPPKNLFDGGFLSFCHACKKSLGQGKDIFMYRGEKAFCSRECRSQEMLFDEGKEEKCSLQLSDPL